MAVNTAFFTNIVSADDGDTVTFANQNTIINVDCSSEDKTVNISSDFLYNGQEVKLFVTGDYTCTIAGAISAEATSKYHFKGVVISDSLEWVSSYQKVLWTGPLATVNVETSLNSGESFDDWDMVVVQGNVLSDTDIAGSGQEGFWLSRVGISRAVRMLGDGGGRLTADIKSSTTFEIVEKTVSAGNIQRMIGVKL